MAGFFKMWRVSGITTDYARLSEPIHELGCCLLMDFESYELLPESYTTEMIAAGIRFLVMKEKFDRYDYLDTKRKDLHDDAVKFLVMAAAISKAQDGQRWSWQSVRELAQGFYSSMDKNPTEFYLMTKLEFDRVEHQIKEMIENDVG